MPTSLQSKVFGCIIITLLCVGTGATLFFSALINTRFLEVERRDAEEDIIKASQVLSGTIEALSRTNRDWAGWDDTYRFIDDLNQQYVDTNLGLQSLATINVNSVILLNNLGEMRFVRGRDLPSPESTHNHLLEYLKNHPDLSKFATLNDYHAGLIQLPTQEFFMLSSAPIITSAHTGPIQGTLIFAKKFDENELSTLRESAKLAVKIEALKEDDLGYFHQIQVIADSEEHLKVSNVIPDINGKPIAKLAITKQRPIYRTGVEAQRQAFWAILGGVTFLGILIILLVRVQIIARIDKLSSDLQRVRADQNLSLRVNVAGSDEISELAIIANGMLDSIEQTYKIVEEGRNTLHVQAEALLRFAEELRVARDKALANSRARDDVLYMLRQELDEPLRQVQELLKDGFHILLTKPNSGETTLILTEKITEVSEKVRSVIDLTQIQSINDSH